MKYCTTVITVQMCGYCKMLSAEKLQYIFVLIFLNTNITNSSIQTDSYLFIYLFLQQHENMLGSTSHPRRSVESSITQTLKYILCNIYFKNHCPEADEHY